MDRFMPQTLDHQGPIYIRLGKGYDPIVTNDNVPFQIGKAIPMREGNDALIVTTGVTLRHSLEAADALAEEGIKASVLHAHTVKPLDAEAIVSRAAKAPVVVTIEEGTLAGGLGSAVAEIIGEANFNEPKRFRRIGIPDVFPDQYGSQDSLMERYSITSAEIISTVKELRLLGQPDLPQVRS